MTLTIEQMYEMQKVMDAKIIKEKVLEGQDLLPNTVLALQVEVAELANEWRGFKHWSNRRTPKMYPLQTCSYCGDEVSYTRPSPFMADSDADMCEDCWNDTQKEYAASNDEHIPDFKDYPHFSEKKPEKLLEEYADCLHLLLSIANQLDLPADNLSVWDDILEGETTILFTDLLHNIGLIIADKFLAKPPVDIKEWQREHLRSALFVFYGLGEQRFGFTFEQIAEAYQTKNEIYHQRQDNGY